MLPLVAIGLPFAAAATVQAAFAGAPAVRQSATYTNPIIDGNHADPWITYFNDSYYFITSEGTENVSIYKSNTLDDFHNSEAVVVWTFGNPDLGDVWAPELHRIDDQWYIYCALPDGPDDADRRMHVLKGSDPNDPLQPFEEIGKIGTPDENYAIDGTVLQNYNGKNYFIWSGKESPETGTVQYIYIAEMDSPSSVIGERVTIHSPYNLDGSKKEWQWASNGYGVNEGPEVLQRGDNTYVVFSTCGSWDPCYNLAIMGLNGTDLDPLNPDSWWANDEAPVMQSSDAGDNFIVYHGWGANDSAGWGSRTARAERFTFAEDNSPIFPVPVGTGVELPAAA
uniref:Glycoside hydrolase family 43 protein n=1 Tax=Schizophyllum commune (strain H4-8 / FGSC 9210) TaxID=578458 RepID=D8PNG6_SCHCM